MYQQTKRALDRLKQSGIAERVVMPGEDQEQFYQLCDDLLLELAPRGRLQEEYVRRIAELLWKKQQLRMKRAESSQQSDTRSPEVIKLEKAIELYHRNKAAQNGTKIDEPNRRGIKSKEEWDEYFGTRSSGNDLEPAKLNPEILSKHRQMVSAVDDQVGDAMRRLLELKRMQNQLELAR